MNKLYIIKMVDFFFFFARNDVKINSHVKFTF